MSLKKLLPLPLRRVSLAAAAAVLALAACGGGDRVEEFRPERLIALGDEASVLVRDPNDTSKVYKYSVNALQADNVTPDCGTYPIWTQVLASNLGMAFPECPSGTLPQVAETRAAAGARVEQVVAQLQALRAANPGEKAVVTVLAGTNDVIDLYERVTASDNPTPEADAIAAARARGSVLGAEIGALATAGPAVIVSTIPDLGRSPYAAARGTAAQSLLAQLSEAFNTGLRVTIPQDGRLVGLVFGNLLGFESGGNVASGYFNAAACSAALPGCTTATLVEGASTANIGNWIWADDRRFGPSTHTQLGANALNRVRNNPF